MAGEYPQYHDSGLWLDQLAWAESIFDELGIRPYTDPELQTISQTFAGDMERMGEGSLKMCKTALSPRENENYNPGDEVLVFEAGGTNLRVAIAVVGADGQLTIKRDDLQNELYHEKNLDRTAFANRDEFLDEVVSATDPILSLSHNLKAIAFIYSFPGDAQETATGIDIKPDPDMSKEFTVPGIGDGYIGQALLEKLEAKGIKGKPIVVLNDTPAVLMSEYGANLGGVCGTGFNLAVSIDGKIFNIEAGGFNGVNKGKMDEIIAFYTSSESLQPAEYQISGLYLGLTMSYATMMLLGMRNNHLPILSLSLGRYIDQINASLISQFLNNDFSSMEKAIDSSLTENDKKILHNLSARLRERSAQLVGTMIGSVVSSHPLNFPENIVKIPMEGSVFWNIPEYVEKVQTYAGKIAPDKQFTFIEKEHAGILGASASALDRRSRRSRLNLEFSPLTS